jgi:ADP-heptose:LPS heptosyltransferase
MDVNITLQEEAEMEEWLHRSGADNLPGPWLAIAPWTNMPAKQWPTERFTEVVLGLQEVIGGTPFVFGGRREQQATEDLVREWGFGVPVAGALKVRQGIALLKRCKIYIGNDCGAMHMAVSAGIRCVAIFSSRDLPGLWEPYGKGHIVLRSSVPCEGCMLSACNNHHNNCLLEISVNQVLEASLSILRN